jgi:hypothetical protein
MMELPNAPVWGEANFVYESERGHLRMWLAAPNVLIQKYWGYTDDDCMRFIEDVWDETLDSCRDRVHIFADTSEQTGFSHGFRTGMVTWNRRVVARTDTYCLLVRSRWIAMAIALVRATIGMPARHAEVTTSRDRFESRLSSVVQLNRPRYELIKGGLHPDAASAAASDQSAPSSEGDSRVR